MERQELIDRARGGDQEAMWELAAEFGSVTTPTSTARPLELHPPKIRARPALARSFRLVNPALRDMMRGLVLGRSKWPLYLWGPVGTGKTLASLCLCDVAVSSLFYTLDQLADLIMDGQSAFHFDQIRQAGLAVLDELGTLTKDNDLHYKAAKRFTDAREEAGRVAVYVSNLKPSDLQTNYDDRIADRMLCGEVFCLGGDSRRRTA